jgi:hypothetical protein
MGRALPARARLAPDWGASSPRSSASGYRPAIQGIAMNVGGVLMLAFIGSLAESAAAQAAFAGRVLAALLADHLDGGGAHGRGGGGGRPEPRRRPPDRAAAGVGVAARVGLAGAAAIGTVFLLAPRVLLAGVRACASPRAHDRRRAAARARRVGAVRRRRAHLHGRPAGHGRHASPLYISLVSQVAVPLGSAS